ncbi:NAD-glutamate dehydrogenase [Oceanicoccus sagamiensis]|uniref:NAD-glutamate dehydrogenase n=1 Tax=Oceanicoccus sagamiensis TaxID=716816 RepID=A0A1X9NL80_9GAMM|nr:NAD-glutamate dehydrogenase [Oceanicoccus sagamiensis]ARN76169.1 NAD-glutamate dehydrogenase [Oceanicoccus sagamiensis]
MVINQGIDRLVAQIIAHLQERLSADEAAKVADFTRQYFAGYASDDIMEREASELGAAMMGSWAYIQQHNIASPKVRVFNPDYQKHGWQLGRTVIAIIARNTPFITESIRGELNRRNIVIHTLHGTIFSMLRDKQHQLRELLPARTVMKAPADCQLGDEVLLYLEIGRCTDRDELAEITATLNEILAEVTLVVDDFEAMTESARQALADAKKLPTKDNIINNDVPEFIQWMIDGHFTFLGYEKLQVEYSDNEPQVSRVKGSALGLLRERQSLGSTDVYNSIKSAASPEALMERSLVFAKSSIRSRVHRLVYPDYVMLRCFDEQGRIIAKHRFLGMYTAKVYNLTPTLIPLIRGKVKEVLDRSGLDPESHEGKDLSRLLDVFPRDELFQSSVKELLATTMAVNKIQERRQVRLFIRYDVYRKFVNCLVYMPKDIYHTELRIKLEALLREAFGAKECEFTTYFSESILSRTHFVLRVDPEHEITVYSKALEEEVVKVTMSWKEHLKNYLIEEFGDEQGSQLLDNYGDAFGPGYRDDFEPRAAIDDIRKIARMNGDGDIEMSFYRRLGDAQETVHFRLIHLDTSLSLSDVMPILENLGLRVESEHPYGIKRKDGKSIWVHEFRLTYGLDTHIDLQNVTEAFQQAFLRIWSGDAESDAFNKLILGTRLDWRAIAMLRAYSRYMKQIQFNFSGDYIAETLCNHLVLTASIVELFNIRFSCDWAGTEDERVQAEQDLEQSIITALDDVENLSEDRILRQYLALIKATLRTNYFQQSADGQSHPYFSFKLSPGLIPDVPLPVPMFEIFVYSPRVEGVHLRGGKVARGGLRWSDRQEDFRTEVLGLVKAQQVKNAVIVPMGAKGGFVAKQLPTDGGREAFQQEGIACYKIFIQGLLDLTDNLIEGSVVPPQQVIRKDEDDTYLVVAADKGTATFSDIANQLSINAGFWLGDAFASGGSAGYDHKKMGITAKGAWVSVQRHFRELGVNVQDTDFTVVGIGDMGGDVFGNGMLLSEHIQLVCAFNHMHIFVDPNPDSAASFVERKRLFEMPRSSWEDYDSALISAGGGIFKRSAKSIAISPEMQKRFDIAETKLTPNALLTAVLKAPVDLLWNGGIGTYVKASSESHADVGDKANDVLRVDAKDLRCMVIGEGGNLGVTQLSRVEFALLGGRSNTDFIDNAAGVDCSDHEVNIKILLNEVVANDEMTEKQRNILLEEMTESVSELVLENNYRQTGALSMAESDAFVRSGEYRRLIGTLEASGKLNRALEFIPEEEALQERRASGKGLTRPELSVLISYVKSELKEELADTSIPDDQYMLAAVETAFPQRLRDDFNTLVHNHRLRKEIIATQLANDMVNHMGITFVDRLAQSTGANSSDIVRAYVTARDVFDMPNLWAQIEALDYKVTSEVQTELMSELMRLVRRASRWFIRNRRGLIEPTIEVANFKQAVSDLHEVLPSLLRGDLKDIRYNICQRYISQGVPEQLASAIASVRELYPFLGIIEASQSMDAPPAKVADLFFCLADRLELDWFAKQISDLKIDNYWQAMARETYRDDLEWQLRTLTEGAMRHICEKGDVEACIERWMEQQHLLVDRWRTMLAELHATEVHEFAMYSVAIRELLDMAQSSKYGEVT